MPLVTQFLSAFVLFCRCCCLFVCLFVFFLCSLLSIVVAAAFIAFQRAFDSVSHGILEMKLERDFGISGTLLGWIRNYLSE